MRHADPRKLLQSKPCIECGKTFHRNKEHTERKWHATRCCGLECAARYARRMRTRIPRKHKPRRPWIARDSWKHPLLQTETVEQYLMRGGMIHRIPTPPDDGKPGNPVQGKLHTWRQRRAIA